MGQNKEGIQHPQISKPQQNSNVNNIDVVNNVEKKPKVKKITKNLIILMI